MLSMADRRALWEERKNILPRIASRLWRRCGRRMQLEDIRQEAALVLWQRACEAESAEEFVYHVWSLTRDRTKRYVAKQITGQSSGYDRSKETWHLNWCEAAPSLSDDRWAALGRWPTTIERCLAKELLLDPTERRIVEERLAGYDLAEIGASLGVTRQAVFTRLHRILARYARQSGSPRRCGGPARRHA